MSDDAASPALPPAVVEDRPPLRRACVVRLGGRSFAVEVTDVREVVVLDAITPVPGAPAPLVGVMNLRGHALPVIEARPLLGLPVGGAVRALVVADGDRRAGVLIESVLGLAGFDEITPMAGVEGVPAGLVRGCVTIESGESVILLDGSALLTAARRSWNPHTGPARATLRARRPVPTPQYGG